MSDLTRIEPIDLSHNAASFLPGDHRIVAYKMTGTLFFGTVGKIETLLDQNRDRALGLVLEMHQVINLDATGLDALKTLLNTLKAEGCSLVLVGPTAQPLELMQRTGFIVELGAANVLTTLDAALARARELATQPNS
jgi:SulP family sulfate permease